jgi:heme exporter protein A
MVPALAVAGLRKRFGRTYAIDDVTLDIPAGAAVALFGANGAGKTTLLRLCSTLLRPTAGSVSVFGKDAGADGAAVRRRIGVLAHDSFLYADLSASENLLFYARLFGLDDPATRVAAMLERLDLVGWSQRPVRTLSRGLAQRCALARALLHQPELLLLDEPFSGLDLHASSGLHDVLAHAHRAGTTIVMSTHDLPQGLALCSTALVMRAGRVAFHGAVAAAEHASFTAEYRQLVAGRAAEMRA